MIDLSTPDTLLYDSAVLSSYIRKNTKESFGYIFLIISIILLSFTMTIECVMWLIRIFSILSSVVPSILVLIRMNVLTAVLKRPSLIPANPGSALSVPLNQLNSFHFHLCHDFLLQASPYRFYCRPRAPWLFHQRSFSPRPFIHRFQKYHQRSCQRC